MGDVPASMLRVIEAVEPPEASWAERAAERQSRLTMPPGSLGRLLEIGRQLAAIQRTDLPDARPSLVAVFAADHGVARSGVSAYPQEVTGQMLANFAAGGAAINAIAGTVGAAIQVVNLGVAFPPPIPKKGWNVHTRPIAEGTADFLLGPAMIREQAFRAVGEGVHIASWWTGKHGYRVIALGEMGIGNSTTAAALIAALTGASPEEVVGRGTGVDDAGLIRKREVVDRALNRHLPACRDVWDVISRMGGFEILGLAGLAIAAARARTLIVLDGLISTAAGLVAARLCPPIAGSLIAGHLGVEPGHAVALKAMGLEPILNLGLRLGEGTGAALALPIIAASANILREMATFESAGVSGRS